MSKQVQLRRGTSVENDAFTGAAGEVTVDIVKNELRLHDGLTPGGAVLARKNYAVAGGTANAITVALSPALQVYAEGVSLKLKIATTNTGPVTLDGNGLGVRPVVLQNGQELVGGQLVAGGVFYLEDDGVQWVLTNPAAVLDGAYVYAGAVQPITTGLLTRANFDSEHYDKRGYHDNSLNNSRITIPVGAGGYYEMKAGVGFALAATGRREGVFYKNGVSLDVGDRRPTSSGSGMRATFSHPPTLLVPGDYIEVFVYQGSGGLLDTVANGPTFLSVRRVG